MCLIPESYFITFSRTTTVGKRASLHAIYRPNFKIKLIKILFTFCFLVSSQSKRLVMKILVCISRTPDTTAKIAFTDNNTKFNQSGVQFIINPYDEWYALVRAVELKEKDPATVIHLINVGESENDAIIRKALAIGGDEAIRVNASRAMTIMWLRKSPQ